MADVDGGDHGHEAVARGGVLFFGNPMRGSSLLDKRPPVEVNPTRCPNPACKPHTNIRKGRPPDRCPRRRSEGHEGWFQGRPDDPGGREREAP
jgi:hypothetical protein